ncbi:MAG: arginine--tRNA ligase [Desulfarculus sp.]|nr:arginine--tRNA ligase [Desulfarculus sp.]
MKDKLTKHLAVALDRAMGQGALPQVAAPAITLERPRQPEHGELATNLALQLAKPCRMNPRAVAQVIVEQLGDAGGILHRAEIAGPGFINFHIQPAAWLAVLPLILAQGPDYGRATLGAGRKALVEFVSANPTGPLHVGHGRGAALGDVLARLLRFVGYDAHSEYYINDAGNQMATLGRSLLVRARQIKGSGEEFPDNHYRGEYMRGLAREFLDLPQHTGVLDMPPEQAVEMASAWAGGKILDGIRDDLSAFGVGIDTWYSERSLVDKGAVRAAFDELRERGLLYEAEGALWFRATAYGDEKDRVVKRGNGELTYFASDIAYHLDKFRRGYGLLVDVWGADHHGYVPRLKAAMAGLDHAPDDLSVVLVQMVNLLRGGVPVAMSTRAGEFVTLKEVVDEVGADSARFIFLTRRSEAQLDFDLEVAKQKSMDNPVFYVQYAHTRVRSVLKKAAEARVPLPDPQAADLAPLALAEEVALARLLGDYPEMVLGAAVNLEPHCVTYYLHELAGAFHSYYNAHHILFEDPPLTAARLVLAMAVGAVLKGGLALLGVSAPEAM